MKTGWIQLHRALLESQVFINEGLLKVWIYCLLRANHEPCWVPINIGRAVTEIKLKPGQFIYGRKEAGKELRMKPSSVRNRMEKLKNMRNLDIQTDTHYSIVTICNWESYQNIKNENGQTKGQPEDNRRTTVGQPEDTENNDKNVKNDKNIIPLEVAGYLLDSICQWDENHKYNRTKPAIQGWAEDIEKAMRIDGRTREQLEFMIEYLFTKNTETSQFWAPNIQSGYKLRQKFDTIKHKIKRELKNGKKTYSDRHNESKQFLDNWFAEQGND